MSDILDLLDDTHKDMTEKLHFRQLATYYPENYSPQIADCIAFNKLLNANRNTEYFDIYGKVEQVPSLERKVEIYYREGSGNGIVADHSQNGNNDATQSVLNDDAQYETVQKYRIEEAMEDSDWVLLPQLMENTTYPIALLPHQRQDQWPIDTFRFNKLETTIIQPNQKVSGYSSLGKKQSDKNEEEVPVLEQIPKNVSQSSYYAWSKYK